MKNPKSINICLALLLAVSFTLTITLADATAKDNVVFKYGVIGKKAEEESNVFAVKDSVIMYSSELIKINFSLNKGKSLYLIWQSPQGNHTLLNLPTIQPTTKEPDNFHATNWFVLDERTGTELLYIVAANKKLKSIEKLFQELSNAAAASMDNINEKIAEELAELQDSDRFSSRKGLLPKRAVKPVESGAVFRGGKVEEDALLEEVSGSGVALKIIRIVHKARNE
ncbi:MAG: hypothetical protein HQ591_04500 [candidate division Zixibacteria bacterium]|nr:hypothetical protein [Candidatus Tariuqbacter arcticus]